MRAPAESTIDSLGKSIRSVGDELTGMFTINGSDESDKAPTSESSPLSFISEMDPTILAIIAGLLAFIGLLIYLQALLRGPRPGEKTLNDFPKEMENAGTSLGFMAAGAVVFLWEPTPQKVFLVAILVMALAALSLMHGIMRRPLSREESRALLAGTAQVDMQYPVVKFGLTAIGVVLFVVSITMDA